MARGMRFGRFLFRAMRRLSRPSVERLIVGLSLLSTHLKDEHLPKDGELLLPQGYQCLVVVPPTQPPTHTPSQQKI
jgi:hypothetical protein